MVSRFTIKDGNIMEIEEGRHRFIFPNGMFYTLPDAEAVVEQFYKNLDSVAWIDDRKETV